MMSKDYLPAVSITNDPRDYEGCVELHHIHVQLVSSNKPLLGCSPLLHWLCRKQCIYTINNTDDTLCIWRCLIISKKIRHNWARLAEDTTRDALNLVHEFYEQPNLQVSDVRPTKLIDFENIASRFQVNIRLYEPVNQLVWRLVFGHMHHRSSLLNVDIGLHEGHCFYIKNLDVLTSSWECSGCQQRFTHHDIYNRHITKRRCNGGRPKLVCSGGKFKHSMNSLEKAFYGRNTQFSWDACRWIECQSELKSRYIHHALCGHGGERCMVIDKKEILVDGYDHETSTIYQFYGCKWYGCLCLGSNNDKYQETLNLENIIRSLRYNVVSVWECKNPELSKKSFQ